jgi:hypothetical protein
LGKGFDTTFSIAFEQREQLDHNPVKTLSIHGVALYMTPETCLSYRCLSRTTLARCLSCSDKCRS